MQTSGLLLDVYDDYNGDVIRSLFPSLEQVPGFVKQAHVLSPEERSQLPDNAFALVLVDEGNRLRKYACIDPGNTELSVMYFLENGHKLPEDAQKVAAANLSTACGWYNLDYPELEKIALLGWAAKQVVRHPMEALNVAMGAPMVEEGYQTAQANNRAISGIRAREGGMSGGRIITPKEIEEERVRTGDLNKSAEISGTHLAPLSKATELPTPSKTTVQKSASMHPYVDVTGQEPTKVASVKVAKLYALGDKYPLDSYDQVKTASSYFDEFGRRFSPEDRREYCTNLYKRAEALGVSVSDDVRHYGVDVFAPDEELKVACELRKNILEEPRLAAVLDGLYEKRAEIGPEMYAATLAEFDKYAGIHFHYDKDIPDAYYSTFHKVAAVEWSEVIGNDMVTERQLRAFAMVGRKSLIKVFGEDMADEFQRDPVAIFKSLPRDQKIVIMRMASANESPEATLRS